MTSARYRCSSLLMAKDQFTSYIPTSRYDSPLCLLRIAILQHPDVLQYILTASLFKKIQNNK